MRDSEISANRAAPQLNGGPLCIGSERDITPSPLPSPPFWGRGIFLFLFLLIIPLFVHTAYAQQEGYIKIHKQAAALLEEAESEFLGGRPQTALNRAKEALEHDPDNYYIYQFIADLYYKMNDYRNAKRYLNKAQKLNPESKVLVEQSEKLETDIGIEEDYRKKRAANFVVKYEGYEQAEFARATLSALNKVYPNINSDLGFRPKDQITVILYTDEKYRNAVGYPDWSSGIYDGKIRVRLGDYTRGTLRLKQILAHEYTHAVIHRITGGNCPIWLNEGLAQLEEPDSELTPIEKARLKELAQKGGLMGIGALSGDSFYDIPRDSITQAYLEAKSFTAYLEKRFYLRKLRSVLKKIGAGISAEEAIESVCRKELSELEQDWKKRLTK